MGMRKGKTEGQKRRRGPLEIVRATYLSGQLRANSNSGTSELRMPLGATLNKLVVDSS